MGGFGGLVMTGLGAGLVDTTGGAGGAGIVALDEDGVWVRGGGAGMPSPVVLGLVIGRPLASTGA